MNKQCLEMGAADSRRGDEADCHESAGRGAAMLRPRRRGVGCRAGQGSSLAGLAMSLALALTAAAAGSERVEWERDDQGGTLKVRIDGRPAFVYQYGATVDLPHYYPLWSPSGQELTIQQTEPYPHHRSIWFADKVQRAGHPTVEFYMALTSRVDPNDAASPFAWRIRHLAFLPGPSEEEGTVMREKLVWEADMGKTPYLDEERELRVMALGEGEYLMDMIFTLVARYGEVTFRSDDVHYAWPYVRMHPQFSVDRGGTLTSSEGVVNQAQTHNTVARWMDYSNTIDGRTEGLAFFSHPDNAYPHRWLTRDYGTFGPRRVDALSGKPFTLKQGQSIRQRVGLLVHQGDVRSGRVAERYQDYAGPALGWISLFNGRDLEGWSVKCQPQDQAKTFWTVEDGVIVCDSMGRKDHNYVWLLSDREFGDFELQLQFQADRDSPGNSGVQIRSRFDAAAKGGWLDGPQIDIHPPADMPWRTGHIYDETRGEQRWVYPSLKDSSMDPKFKPARHLFKYAEDGDGWNRLSILCRGTHIQTILNGVQVADWDGAGVLDNEAHRVRDVGLRGHVALQLHSGDELRIRFKDVRIRELPSKP